MKFKKWILNESDMGDAMRKAVAANPHDSAGWLVYADWLEEHNNDYPQATLIRLLFQKEKISTNELNPFELAKAINVPYGSFNQFRGYIKRTFPFVFQNLITKDPWLASYFNIAKKRFRGVYVPYYQLGFLRDEDGIVWAAYKPRGNAMSAWLRLETPGHRALFIYDPAGYHSRRINKGQEYVPGVHSPEEATINLWD